MRQLRILTTLLLAWVLSGVVTDVSVASGSWSAAAPPPVKLRFHEPTFVAVAPGGTVYVFNQYTSTVQSILPSGKPGVLWSKLAATTGLAADGKGRVYLTSDSAAGLRMFSSDGKLLRTFSLGSSSGVAIGPNNTVYVAHSVPKKGTEIVKLSSSGTVMARIPVALKRTIPIPTFPCPRVDCTGGVGTPAPEAVAVRADGTIAIIVSVQIDQGKNSTSDLILQWRSAAGKLLAESDSGGAAAALAFLRDGSLAVANNDNFARVVAMNGKMKRKIEASGSCGAASVDGVAAAPDGTIYTSDAGDDVLTHFSAGGAQLGQYGVCNHK